MKRFLCGVDGVAVGGGSEDGEAFVGGVLDLEGSWVALE